MVEIIDMGRKNEFEAFKDDIKDMKGEILNKLIFLRTHNSHT
jgi:hypothetical protein